MIIFKTLTPWEGKHTIDKKIKNKNKQTPHH
jgi:hypothetical protein